MKQAISLIAFVAAFPALAEEARQLDAHEHGVGTLNIAIEGTTVAMAFEAPGADIVGFEYAAESDADLAAIEAAVGTLGAPLDLFVMPSAAGCSVVKAMAALEGEEHDNHGEEHHDDHKDHADDKHDDHGHDEHAGHDHEKDDHADEAGHTEFHAEYTLNCTNPDALTQITFDYFEAFANANEVEVQIITNSGAQAFEVERDTPVLTLGS